MARIGLSLGTRTHLAASAQMQQAIRLLQLSALDFTQELQQALGINPFLEEVETENADVEESSEPHEDEIVDHEGDDPVEAPLGDDTAFEALDEIAARDEPRDPFEVSSPASSSLSPSSGSSSADPCDWVPAPTSLREHLLGQICGLAMDLRRRCAAAIVVDSLDDDGYLRCDLAEAAVALGIEPPLSETEIRDGLSFVRGCDPAGVGARDLSDCLGLQIHSLPEETPGRPLAGLIVGQHLDALAHLRYAALRQALSCGDEELNVACQLIRRMDPRPGHRYSSQPAAYVIPDVIVRSHGGTLVVTVNPAARPGARLNQCYIQWFRAARHQEHPALSQQLQEARWLMHNVEQRFVTIHLVAEAIVRRQRGFFDGGEIALKPLVLREIADDLGIHESTVSRATSNKYMQTPRGLFEFRHFFSRSLATETGTACSAASVRALMSDMLSKEVATTPLSDVALARMLGQNGVRVSRRTVTKYRNLMKVASVELRKRA